MGREARLGQAAMSGAGKANPYEIDLDKTPANYAPLTPLGFIERAAHVYPGRVAVIHGARRYTWSETYLFQAEVAIRGPRVSAAQTGAIPQTTYSAAPRG